ncbi:MAG: XTP/dITP diphosphatase [Bacillota bacterium]|nr:XTP/dITP diphosphatase [Bacillota bacterium]
MNRPLTIVAATSNKGKLRELRQLLSGLDITVLSMAEAGVSADIEETGTTFEENAMLKAEGVMRLCGLPTFADDSGLSVDALNGAPGVYSARYAGENATDRDRTLKLLDAVKDIPDEKRGAHFVSAIAFASPDGKSFTVTGKCFGVITREIQGENGFGYDPIFLVPEYNKTFGQMPDEIKNKISHRAEAMRLFLQKIKEYI